MNDERKATMHERVVRALGGSVEGKRVGVLAREQAEPLFKDVEVVGEADGAAKDADALVIVTEWDEFRALDLDRLARIMRGKVIVDLRNVYDRADAEEAGFQYSGLGRGPVDGVSPATLVKNGATN